MMAATKQSRRAASCIGRLSAAQSGRRMPRRRNVGETNVVISPTTIIIWLIVGAIAGWLAGQIVKGHGFGLVGNIVVGIVGAVIAGWLLPMAGLGLPGILGSIIYAVIGA